MNILQERIVHNAKSSIEATRRALAELESFGWKLSLTAPVSDFDEMLSTLEANTRAMKALKPRADKSHEKELTNLIEKESYLIESLDSLARAACESLKREQLAFFEKRDTLTAPMKEQVARADEELQNALEIFAGALQRKWTAILAFHQVNMTLHKISNEHGTDPRLGEPQMFLYGAFKGKIGTWYEFVKLHFAKLAEVVSGGESWSPRDIARRAFEK